jgi:hypothetical protein
VRARVRKCVCVCVCVCERESEMGGRFEKRRSRFRIGTEWGERREEAEGGLLPPPCMLYNVI